MSGLVGNPEDRFSFDAAGSHGLNIRLFILIEFLFILIASPLASPFPISDISSSKGIKGLRTYLIYLNITQ